MSRRRFAVLLAVITLLSIAFVAALFCIAWELHQANAWARKQAPPRYHFTTIEGQPGRVDIDSGYVEIFLPNGRGWMPYVLSSFKPGQ